MLKKLKAIVGINTVSSQIETLRAYRCYDGIIEPLAPLLKDANTDLSDNLVQESGLVGIDGQVFDLTQEGVYRFFRLPSVAEQRLVSKGEVSSLLRSVGYLWFYGGEDNNLTNEQLLIAARSRPVTAGCGNLSFFAISLMEKYNVQTRLVAGMTDATWNGYDDGHTLIEIFWNHRWCLYDPSFHALFRTAEGYASLADVARAGMQGITLERLASLPGHGGYSRDDYNYAFWVEERILSEDRLKAWYARVLSVPMIFSEGQFFYPRFLTEDSEAQFKARYAGLNEQEFLQRFYGELPC